MLYHAEQKHNSRPRNNEIDHAHGHFPSPAGVLLAVALRAFEATVTSDACFRSKYWLSLVLICDGVPADAGVLLPLVTCPRLPFESVRGGCLDDLYPVAVRGRRLLAPAAASPPLGVVFDLFILGTMNAGDPSLTIVGPSLLSGRTAAEPLIYPTPFLCLRGVCETTLSGASKKPMDALSDRPSCGEVGILICRSNRCGGVVLALALRTTLGCFRLPAL